MPSTTTTTTEKSPSAPTLTASPAPDKENPGSDATKKQRVMTIEETHRMFRESREEVLKMSDEELAEKFPWIKQFKNTAGIPPSKVPDEIWDLL
ncbi:hypothetical protein GGR54DRAFT_640446 [Hypoxylon sp. NC1633]|nr:hypothetical protein GGR54DRAFT_640446 [Hypoxylon sp. NC1633]